MKYPVYYVTYGDLNVLSLVEHPAIEKNFEYFSKHVPVQFSLDEEKHIAFGPAMIADFPIYRIHPETKEGYYLVFTADIIEKMVLDAERQKKLTFSLEHSGENTDKVYMVESFISRPGLQPEQFADVPYGSWYVSLKIEDDQIWEDLKNGKYNGFSIEAVVDCMTCPELDPIDEEINNILD